jgi:hypothetical protein
MNLGRFKFFKVKQVCNCCSSTNNGDNNTYIIIYCNHHHLLTTLCYHPKHSKSFNCYLWLPQVLQDWQVRWVQFTFRVDAKKQGDKGTSKGKFSATPRENELTAQSSQGSDGCRFSLNQWHSVRQFTEPSKLLQGHLCKTTKEQWCAMFSAKPQENKLTAQSSQGSDGCRFSLNQWHSVRLFMEPPKLLQGQESIKCLCILPNSLMVVSVVAKVIKVSDWQVHKKERKV